MYKQLITLDEENFNAIESIEDLREVISDLEQENQAGKPQVGIFGIFKLSFCCWDLKL
jgi:uncharacterized protein YjgD (DUF1641 family)